MTENPDQLDPPETLDHQDHRESVVRSDPLDPRARTDFPDLTVSMAAVETED